MAFSARSYARGSRRRRCSEDARRGRGEPLCHAPAAKVLALKGASDAAAAEQGDEPSFRSNGGARAGKLPCPGSRFARLWPDDELGYSSTAHANVLTATQIAAQSPRDVSNTRVKDAPVLSRARSPCGRADD